jgi:hypothetical protein
LDKGLRDFAQRVFAGEDKDHEPCGDCGGVHTRACPRIASLHVVIGTAGESKGVIIERDVTYWAPGVWEKDIIFAGDVWEDDDDDDASGSDNSAD